MSNGIGARKWNKTGEGKKRNLTWKPQNITKVETSSVAASLSNLSPLYFIRPALWMHSHQGSRTTNYQKSLHLTIDVYVYSFHLRIKSYEI